MNWTNLTVLMMSIVLLIVSINLKTLNSNFNNHGHKWIDACCCEAGE